MLLLAAPQARAIGVMNPAAAALAGACWPGGLTVVVPQRPDVALPDVLTGGAPTIGLRVPDHDAPRALARGVGPLPVTSANVSGLPEAAMRPRSSAQLGDAVDLILDGGPRARRPGLDRRGLHRRASARAADGGDPGGAVAAILEAVGIALEGSSV